MLEVTSLMSSDVVSVSAAAPLSVVRECFEEGDFHHLPVLDDERLVGVISMSDLLRTENVRDSDRLTARDLMHVGPVTIQRGSSVLEAAQILGAGNLHSLPVVDTKGRLEGMLTSTDLIRMLIKLLGGDE